MKQGVKQVLKVKEIMISDVVTMTVENSVAEVREVMAEKNIRHMPIINGSQELVGIVTQRDVLRAGPSSLSESDRIAESDTSVEKIMTTKVRSVHPLDSLRGAGLIMQSKKLGCLPVVEEGKLVGIITDSDFVGVAINLIEEHDHHESDQSYQDDDF